MLFGDSGICEICSWIIDPQIFHKTPGLEVKQAWTTGDVVGSQKQSTLSLMIIVVKLAINAMRIRMIEYFHLLYVMLHNYRKHVCVMKLYTTKCTFGV